MAMVCMDKLNPADTGSRSTPWPKYVSCGYGKGSILYVIRYQNRYMISMQSIDEAKLSRPVAIDYIEGTYHLAFLDKRRSATFLCKHG